MPLNWPGRGPFRRRGDRVEVRLPPEERELLRSLPGNVREALAELDPDHAEDDPAAARLFPSAYKDHPENDKEFRRLMHQELASGRLAAFDAFEATVDAESLDQAQAEAWLRAVNDTRLLLGVRLEVTEDDASRRVEVGDPRAAALAVYHFLTWLQEELVEALA